MGFDPNFSRKHDDSPTFDYWVRTKKELEEMLKILDYLGYSFSKNRSTLFHVCCIKPCTRSAFFWGSKEYAKPCGSHITKPILEEILKDLVTHKLTH